MCRISELEGHLHAIKIIGRVPGSDRPPSPTLFSLHLLLSILCSILSAHPTPFGAHFLLVQGEGGAPWSGRCPMESGIRHCWPWPWPWHKCRVSSPIREMIFQPRPMKYNEGPRDCTSSSVKNDAVIFRQGNWRPLRTAPSTIFCLMIP